MRVKTRAARVSNHFVVDIGAPEAGAGRSAVVRQQTGRWGRVGGDGDVQSLRIVCSLRQSDSRSNINASILGAITMAQKSQNPKTKPLSDFFLKNELSHVVFAHLDCAS